jgi:hypothetical protein
MGVLDTINDFLRHHRIRDVARELKQEIRDEKYIERIDNEIIKLSDESLKHAKDRKGIIEGIEQARGIRISAQNVRSLVQYYTQVNRVIKRFEELKEEEHDNKGTTQRMDQLVKKDYELFQKFSQKLKRKAPHVFSAIEEKLGDFLDQRRLKETMSKLYNDQRWIKYEEQEEITIDKEINAKVKGLKNYSEREEALFNEIKEKIDNEKENVEEKFKLVLADKTNTEKISAAASSLKRMFIEFPRQQLTNLIDQQIDALNAIRRNEFEKREVIAKIESVLVSEELLMIKLEKGRLEYDSSITLVFPEVKTTKTQIMRFITNDIIKFKRKHMIVMAEMYKNAGKPIDNAKIKEFVESDNSKQQIRKEVEDRLKLIQRTLKMKPTRITIKIYKQVIDHEDELSSRNGSLERHVMRGMAREFLPQKIADTDQLTELNFLNLLRYALFLKLNKKILEETFNQIPRISHVKKEIDYIALTDVLIDKKFNQNIFEENPEST